MRIININPALFIFAPEAIAARKLADPKDADYAEFLQLKTAIKNQGLQNIFSVTERDGKYLVLDGNRRGLAVQQLFAENDSEMLSKYPEGIPVQVLDASDADVLLLQISGNANVNKQKAASLAKALHKALLMTNITIADLAKRAGLTTVYTENLLKLNMLPEKVKVAIDAGEITATNAFHLNRLPSELLDEEMIDQAKIRSGPDMANIVDTAKKAFIAAKKAGEPTASVDGNIVFNPSPKLRMKAELESMYNLSLERAQAEPSEANIAYANAMRYCFRMDDATLESDRRAFELAQEKKAEDKKKRAIEREAKKTEDILKTLAGNPELEKKLREQLNAPKLPA
jgi:ParB-like chromosome segregation protein Spo0J